MFIIATGLIAKFSQNSSRTYAAAAVTFLFLYVFLWVLAIIKPNRARRKRYIDILSFVQLRCFYWRQSIHRRNRNLSNASPLAGLIILACSILSYGCPVGRLSCHCPSNYWLEILSCVSLTRHCTSHSLVVQAPRGMFTHYNFIHELIVWMSRHPASHWRRLTRYLAKIRLLQPMKNLVIRQLQLKRSTIREILSQFKEYYYGNVLRVIILD